MKTKKPFYFHLKVSGNDHIFYESHAELRGFSELDAINFLQIAIVQLQRAHEMKQRNEVSKDEHRS